MTEEIKEEIKEVSQIENQAKDKMPQGQNPNEQLQLAINKELSFAEETIVRSLRGCIINVVNIINTANNANVNTQQ